MFNYILSQYHLQEKDWLYSDPSLFKSIVTLNLTLS